MSQSVSLWVSKINTLYDRTTMNVFKVRWIRILELKEPQKKFNKITWQEMLSCLKLPPSLTSAFRTFSVQETSLEVKVTDKMDNKIIHSLHCIWKNNYCSAWALSKTWNRSEQTPNLQHNPTSPPCTFVSVLGTKSI